MMVIKVGDRVRVKDGWAEYGKEGTVLAIVTSAKGQGWASVQWDGEEDPDHFKIAGLEKFEPIDALWPVPWTANNFLIKDSTDREVCHLGGQANRSDPHATTVLVKMIVDAVNDYVPRQKSKVGQVTKNTKILRG